MEFLDELAKLVPAIGVIIEHVEGRCSWAEEHEFSRLRLCGGDLHCTLQRAPRIVARNSWPPESLDPLRHIADQHGATAFLRDQVGDAFELEPFVFAAGNQDDWPRLAGKRLLHGIEIRRF